MAMIFAAMDPGTALWIEVVIIMTVFAAALLVRPRNHDT